MPVSRRPARASRGLTGRALVLCGVLVLLVVILAAPLHRYLSARGAVSQAAQQHRQSQQQLQQLQKQLDQWNDPSYVEAQARKRLQYALPGDTTYIVVTPGHTSPERGSTPAETGVQRLPGQTWNQRLWGSLQAADAAP